MSTTSFAERARQYLAEGCDKKIPDGEISELSEISRVANEMSSSPAPSGVWWADPTTRPLPADADEWDKGMRESFSPIVHLPLRGCLGPTVCSRVGPCVRHATGRPCEVTS